MIGHWFFGRLFRQHLAGRDNGSCPFPEFSNFWRFFDPTFPGSMFRFTPYS